MGYPGHRYRLPSSPGYRGIGMLPLMNTKSCSASSLRMLAARVGVVLAMSFHRRVISVGLMGNHAKQFAIASRPPSATHPSASQTSWVRLGLVWWPFLCQVTSRDEVGTVPVHMSPFHASRGSASWCVRVVGPIPWCWMCLLGTPEDSL